MSGIRQLLTALEEANRNLIEQNRDLSAELEAVKRTAVDMRDSYNIPAFFTWETELSLYSVRFGAHPWEPPYTVGGDDD